MNSPVDSIRPTTQAELPAPAHVTGRDERGRKDMPKKPEKKKRQHEDQAPEESPQAKPASPRDDSTGTIDLLA